MEEGEGGRKVLLKECRWWWSGLVGLVDEAIE